MYAQMEMYALHVPLALLPLLVLIAKLASIRLVLEIVPLATPARQSVIDVTLAPVGVFVTHAHKVLLEIVVKNALWDTMEQRAIPAQSATGELCAKTVLRPTIGPMMGTVLLVQVLALSALLVRVAYSARGAIQDIMEILVGVVFLPTIWSVAQPLVTLVVLILVQAVLPAQMPIVVLAARLDMA
jgi:hypothetical protein